APRPLPRSPSACRRAEISYPPNRPTDPGKVPPSLRVARPKARLAREYPPRSRVREILLPNEQVSNRSLQPGITDDPTVLRRDMKSPCVLVITCHPIRHDHTRIVVEMRVSHSERFEDIGIGEFAE